MPERRSFGSGGDDYDNSSVLMLEVSIRLFTKICPHEIMHPSAGCRDGSENGEAGWPTIDCDSAAKEYVIDRY